MNANQVRNRLMKNRNDEILRQLKDKLENAKVHAAQGLYLYEVGLLDAAIAESLAHRRIEYINGVIDVSKSSIARQADAFWTDLKNRDGLTLLDANFKAFTQSNEKTISGEIHKAELDLTSFFEKAGMAPDLCYEFSIGAAIFLERKGFKPAIARELFLLVEV